MIFYNIKIFKKYYYNLWFGIFALYTKVIIIFKTFLFCCVSKGQDDKDGFEQLFALSL